MLNVRDHIVELGKIVKCKNINPKIIYPLLHKTSVFLNTSNITYGNFFVKYTDHLCLFDADTVGRDYVFVVNATSSAKLHNIPSIPCASIHQSILADQIPLVKICRNPGYYAYSYVNSEFLDSKYFEGQASIKLATGLTQKVEQSKVFNTVLNTYRFKYMTEIANHKQTSILLTDLVGDGSNSYLLKNNRIIEFMSCNDKDNILLDINRIDIDDNFKAGLDHINNVVGIETVTNLCNYGNEGLDYLAIIGS